MKTHKIAELAEKIGQSVQVSGWIHTIRKQSKVIFVVLRDSTGNVQCVIENDNDGLFEIAKGLTEESTITIDGMVNADERSKVGYEIIAKQIKVSSSADAQKPMPIFGAGSDDVDQNVRSDYRWLDLRKPEKRLVFEVWTTLEQALRDFWIKNDFTQVHSPKLMDAASEGGAEFFEVSYFERKAYLAQSPQFYKQMAMAAGMDRVFEIGPVFRAEPSFTTRHSTEFTGYDLEMAWISSHEDVMEFWEQSIKHALNKVQERHGEKIFDLYERKLDIPKTPFPRISLFEAKKILSSRGITSEKEGDLSPEEEREICKYVLETEGHEFVFITEYPAAARAFYHMRLESDNTLTKGFDLLWNGIEVTTGAQREHRYDVLKKQAIEKGIDPKSIEQYLNFFKFGCPPHGGMGSGAARLIMKILDLPTIREAEFLHRSVRRLTP